MKAPCRSRYENQEASALNEIKFALLLRKKENEEKGELASGWRKKKKQKEKGGLAKARSSSLFPLLNAQRSARFPPLEVNVSSRIQ